MQASGHMPSNIGKQVVAQSVTLKLHDVAVLAVLAVDACKLARLVHQHSNAACLTLYFFYPVGDLQHGLRSLCIYTMTLFMASTVQDACTLVHHMSFFNT